MCDFIFEHKERQRKKHFCLLRCLSAFVTPIKLYFDVFFKLLPYVALAFSEGSFFILLACVFWGIENNCTRALSENDPLNIVLLKGIFSGGTSLVLALVIGEKALDIWSVFAVLAVGCVSYGMSIFVYVYAQRILGAARTSAYYAVSPFIGTAVSLLIFSGRPGIQYFSALGIMIIGAWLSSSDEPIF